MNADHRQPISVTPIKPIHLKTTALTAAIIAATLMTGCATSPMPPEGSAEVRSKLTQLQSDPQLASRAPVAIQEAEAAVVMAEQPQRNEATGAHRVYLADHKVDIASARAQTRLLEDQRKALSEQREQARLDARTREADSARRDAKVARTDAETARMEAENARMGASMAMKDADTARMNAEQAMLESDKARQDMMAAHAQSAELQSQIDALNAKATERGLVVTLGDLLFATGKSEIKTSASGHLDKLAAFLNKYEDRSVEIEGHTDSVGSESSNLTLSQRRAEAVKNHLLSRGVAASRIETSGKGETAPLTDNETTSGRQQNRRVEVIITNANVSMTQKSN